MHCLVALLVLVAVVYACRHQKGGDGPPNFIFFMADDYGYNDVGHRNPDIVTPNFDALVEDGILFTNAYTSQQCSPSRSSFLSARYAHTTGTQHGVITYDTPNCMDLKFKMLPEYMKDLGYNTHMAGKWHLGYCNKECTPTYRGFDSFKGGFSGGSDYYRHTTHENLYDWHNGIETEWEAWGTHSQDLIMEEVISQIKNSNGTPFFIYTAFHNTHSPMMPKREFYELYKDMDAPEDRKKYLGLVSGMDYVVGEIVSALKDTGLWENTYLFFTSDNGGDVHEGDNTPKRGAKSSLFEGGCHANAWVASPLLEVKGVEAEGLLHITDWMPTILDLAGGSLAEEDIDGIVQTDLITRAGESQRTTIIYNIDMEAEVGPPNFGSMAARNERYKLMWGFEGRTDGYGLETNFVFNMEYYRNLVDENAKVKSKIDKRGGPYFLTMEEQYYLDEYVAMTTVTLRNVEEGTGHMHLFDLQDDPNETTDLIDSDVQEHIEAKEELISLLRDAIFSDRYYKLYRPYQVVSQSFDGQTKGVLEPGWCESEYP